MVKYGETRKGDSTYKKRISKDSAPTGPRLASWNNALLERLDMVILMQWKDELHGNLCENGKFFVHSM
jgi:hypothetical protein